VDNRLPSSGIAERLIRLLAARTHTLVAAESCTAGLLADAFASVPGASTVFWGSFVCYTPSAKTAMLGVDGVMLQRHGAVSAETAVAMAAGALDRSGADIGVSITGLAGPGGDGSAVKVGTVWVTVASRSAPPQSAVFYFTGSRNEIRQRAVKAALGRIAAFL
jgi:PncC family amidohydrolase